MVLPGYVEGLRGNRIIEIGSYFKECESFQSVSLQTLKRTNITKNNYLTKIKIVHYYILLYITTILSHCQSNNNYNNYYKRHILLIQSGDSQKLIKCTVHFYEHKCNSIWLTNCNLKIYLYLYQIDNLLFINQDIRYLKQYQHSINVQTINAALNNKYWWLQKNILVIIN